MILTIRDIVNGIRDLGIGHETPVFIHASLSEIGDVRGGPEAVIGGLLMCFETILMPAFTYKTMLIPGDGPVNNGIEYGAGKTLNRLASFYEPDLPADRTLGVISESFRKHPNAERSTHPILSFSGINASSYLRAQNFDDPLAPLRLLSEKNGWVILMGVEQKSNTGIHFAEKQAERKQFTRWALTPLGVKECRNFPGCSDGFNDVDPFLRSVSRELYIGQAKVKAVSVRDLVRILVKCLEKDPLAFLCRRTECLSCLAVRQHVHEQRARMNAG